MSHRRNQSINSNSSERSSINNPPLAHIDTSENKNHLSNLINDNNLQPSTPSKNKIPRYPVNIKNDPPRSVILEIRNMFFMLMFCGALVIFLGALSGMGPPFDNEMNVVISNETFNEIIDNNGNFIDEDSQFLDNNFELEGNDDKIDQIEPEEIIDEEFHEIIDPELIIEEGRVNQNSPETPENELNLNPDEIIEDKDENDENDENDEESGSGLSDEILSNNDNILTNENKTEQIDKEIIYNFTEGLPNKLKNKKDNYRKTIPLRYEVDGSEIQNKGYDYSNYTYTREKTHFTYDDVFGSLTDEERESIHKTQLLEMNTDESLEPSCGSWQNNYSRLHERILSGDEVQRYVSYMCDDENNCGGLSDRILGMTSAFVFALLTNRAFLADWQTPFPLETVFNSPNIDWSHDSLNPSPDIKELETSELNVIDFDAKNLDQQFMLSNWTLKYPSPFIKFYSNRGMIIRSFDSKYYSQSLKEMGLRPHTTFGCVLDYLFRPAPSALSFITQYTSLFTLPSVFTVGIQIKTRDDATSLQDYENFFACADQLTQTYAAPHQKVIYYLVTDSLILRNSAIQKFEYVVVSGLPTDSDLDNLDDADRTNNAIIESWIFSRSDFRIISPGDYGKLAAFYSKQLHTTISMDYDKALDCTREDAFITFSKLASESSLG